MERRAFLALIASAPIAALAQWPKLLPTPDRIAFHPNAFAMTMAGLDRPAFLAATGTFDVIYGRGFVRRGTDELWEIEPIGPDAGTYL